MLHEWRTGVKQAVEFSANAYLDVYYGHLETFTHIKNQRAGAFHHDGRHIYQGKVSF